MAGPRAVIRPGKGRQDAAGPSACRRRRKLIDYQFLIRNGTIVDGTGAPAYQADIRVRHGLIHAIGKDLAPEGRERVIDAAGCYVTPGFIESHNHWDAGVWWSPMLEPNAAYGITTSVNGFCGFSLAPMSPDPRIRAEMIDIFNYFEDIPARAQETVLPWDWERWSEYRRSFERNVKLPLNFGVFCGHIPIRLTVMGLDAWERAATAEEIARMCDLLEDALDAGAMGMSSNVMDRDRTGRKVPPMHASDEEWLALLGVLGRRPGTMLQIMLDAVRELNGPEQLEWIAGLAKQTGARVLWAGTPRLKFQAPMLPRFREVQARYRAQGVELWPGFHHIAPTVVFTLNAGLMFGQQGSSVWQGLTNEGDEARKEAMLADPAWLAKARASWDEELYPHSVLRDPTSMTFIESQSGYGPIGVTLADYMAQKGIAHPSDALADWLLYNGTASVIHKRSWEIDEEVVIELMRDEHGAGNGTDGGAHGQSLCGAGDNIALLTEYVRDNPRLTIEEAIYGMTGKLARCYALNDRGVIKEGMKADIAVFDLAEVERRREEKVWDVPDGDGGRTYRYSRAPAPMRLTLCNGVATFDNGTVTGRFPGEIVSPENVRVSEEA